MNEEERKKKIENDINKANPPVNTNNESHKTKRMTLAKLSDETFIENLRTTIIIIVVLGLGFIYLGIFNQLNFEALLKPEITGLGAVGFSSMRLFRWEVINRSMKKGYIECEELQQVDHDISTEFEKHNIDNVIIVFDEENGNGRRQYNVMKTQSKIQKLNNKLYKLKIRKKTKKIANIDNKIKELKKEPLKIRWYHIFTKKYKNINIHQLLKKGVNYNNVGISGNNKYSYKTRNHKKYQSLFTSAFKFLGITSAFAVPFILETSLITILFYYLFLLLSMGWCLVRLYPKIIELRATTELLTKQNKLKLLQKINAYVPTKKEDN